MVNKVYVLINTDPGKTEEVRTQLKKINHVKTVDIVTGRYDLIAILEGKELNLLLSTVAKDMHNVKGIEKTETLVSVDMNEKA